MDQWYLPHFAVARDDKSTAKVRIVFDASAVCDGKSLNEQMHVGMRMQNDLVHALLQLCLEPVALCGNISEKFLFKLACMNEIRTTIHRFLWRQNPSEPCKVLQFTQLVFRVKASPFLAGRALQETAARFGHQYLDAVGIVPNNFYVGDFLQSLPTTDEAIKAREDVSALLQAGGFHIRKWMTNSNDVLQSIPVDDRAPSKTATIIAPYRRQRLSE